MIKKILTTVFLMSVFLYSQEKVETNSGISTNYISYQYYIDTIKTSLPDIMLNYISVQKSENSLMRAKSVGDVDLSAKLGAIGQYGAQNSISQTTPSVAGDGLNWDVGVGSLIPYSGTKWSVSLSHDMLAYRKPLKAAGYAPSINLTITQPLLKNFLGMADRFYIKDASLAVDIAKLNSSINNNAVLVSYQKLYYQWIAYEKIISELSSALSNAKSLENQTLRRYRAGLIDNDSYQQSKAKVFQYQDSLTQYMFNINSLIDQIKFFITNDGMLRPEQSEWDKQIAIVSNEKLSYIDFPESTYGKLAEQNGYKIAQAVAVQKNLTFPELSLVGNVSVGANDTSGYFKSFSKMNNVDYFIGFQFSYPIGNRSAKADLREAELMLEQFNAEYRSTLMTYDGSMKDYIKRNDTLVSLMETKKNLIDSLASTLATQRSKYNQGRLELIDLINTETEITVQRMNFIDIQMQFINNYFDYKELFTLTYTL